MTSPQKPDLDQASIEPPRAGGLLREVRGLWELPRLLARWPHLTAAPRGDRHVIVLPGFGAGDGSTAVLRGYLRYLGHRARGWSLGTNRGDVWDLIPRVTRVVAEAAEREGAPVALVGWSLGGVLAREAARERPDAVRQVITLGSPVVGGPKYTAVADFYRRRGIDLDEIEADVALRDRTPLSTPVAAVYSRSDAVVAWRACIDHTNRQVEHLEVETTHLGLGFAPEVYRLIADRLADAS